MESFADGPIIGERKEIFDQRIHTGNLLCSPVTVWGVVSRHSTDQQTHLNSLLYIVMSEVPTHTVGYKAVKRDQIKTGL